MKFVKGLSILGLTLAAMAGGSGKAFAVDSTSDKEAVAYFTSTLACHITISDRGNLAREGVPESRLLLDATLNPDGSLSIAGADGLTASGTCPFTVTLGAFDMTDGINTVKMVGSFNSASMPLKAESDQSTAGSIPGHYQANYPFYVFNAAIQGVSNPSSGQHWEAGMSIIGQMTMTVATP